MKLFAVATLAVAVLALPGCKHFACKKTTVEEVAHHAEPVTDEAAAVVEGHEGAAHEAHVTETHVESEIK